MLADMVALPSTIIFKLFGWFVLENVKFGIEQERLKVVW